MLAVTTLPTVPLLAILNQTNTQVLNLVNLKSVYFNRLPKLICQFIFCAEFLPAFCSFLFWADAVSVTRFGKSEHHFGNFLRT